MQRQQDDISTDLTKKTPEPRMTRSRKRLAQNIGDQKLLKLTCEEDEKTKRSKEHFSDKDIVKKQVLVKDEKTEDSKKVAKKRNISRPSSARKGTETSLSIKKEQEKTKRSNVKRKKENTCTLKGDETRTSQETGRHLEINEEATSLEMAGFIAKGGKYIGAHTSAAGGIWNAVTDAVAIKGRAFALFLKSQRQWKAKPLEEEVVSKFQTAVKEAGYDPDFILPHGSYLLNCGSPNPETLQKSRDALLEEVQRCQRLGLNRYNFHPGSTCGDISVEKCLDLIGESINDVIKHTSDVTLVVENMSCQGNTIGGKFDELKGIIDRVEDKSRIGVCLDTCHAFAAGYDLSTKEGYIKMMAEFEDVVGFQYLKGVHLNDSKGKVGCHLDRHENIGKGFIGLKGFKRLMNDRRFNGIPMILETPPGADYKKEINLLYSLID